MKTEYGDVASDLIFGVLTLSHTTFRRTSFRNTKKVYWKIHKSLIFWYILKIFTGLVGKPLTKLWNSVFCIKTSITKYPGLITPLAQTPRGTQKKCKFKFKKKFDRRRESIMGRPIL
jgi:hypothetical protein